MDPRANFDGVIRELGELVESPKQYDLLRIPGLLRLLLFDSSPLMDQVNREFRLKIRFRVGHHLNPERSPDGKPLPSSTLFESVADSFDPDLVSGMKESIPLPWSPIEVTRDQLLKLFVIIVQGEYLTVKELIEHLAYVQGLTHSGQPKQLKDEALLGWRRLVRLSGYPPGLAEVRAIGRVVHRGLLPLHSVLLEEYS